ncbi:MAG: hypothetical protein U0176_03280 [Bacteroidia bacterium]
MKKLLLFACSLLFSLLVQAQNSYTISSISFNPDPYTAGTPTGIAMDDIWGSVVALPFSFCYYDQSYDSIVIGSNGIVSFNLALASTYCQWPISGPVPNAAYDNLTIMAPWQDIDPSQGGTIKYDVRGVAPYRRFIVSYYEVPMFSCTSLKFSEQVILYETSNLIETHILTKPLCSTWNGGAAAHGMQVNGTTAYMVPGRNYPTQWTAFGDGYRFSPVGTCAGPLPADSVLGKVFTDYNNNCIQDPNEYPIQNRLVLANGGAYYAWTGANGRYGMGLAAGSYAITEVASSPFYASTCLPGGAYNVTLSNTVYPNADFADSVSLICSDLTVDLGSSALRRCGTSLGAFTFCNEGSYPDSNVVVVITLNDSITIDSTPVPYISLGSNQYQFNVGNLMPGQCGTIPLYLGIGCDTIGTVYCMNAVISGTYATECDTSNNHSTHCGNLVAAFDPNEKIVAAQNGSGWVREDDIDANDVLNYQINFQNLGSSYAIDVVVRDTIDAQLRIETLDVGAGSAPFTYAIVGNVITFTFDNILLPAASVDELGSHGFVKYSIEQQPGHGPGTEIRNRASIYFDAEAPVLTNQTVNTIPRELHPSRPIHGGPDLPQPRPRSDHGPADGRAGDGTRDDRPERQSGAHGDPQWSARGCVHP